MSDIGGMRYAMRIRSERTSKLSGGTRIVKHSISRLESRSSASDLFQAASKRTAMLVLVPESAFHFSVQSRGAGWPRHWRHILARLRAELLTVNHGTTDSRNDGLFFPAAFVRSDISSPRDDWPPAAQSRSRMSPQYMCFGPRLISHSTNADLLAEDNPLFSGIETDVVDIR